MAVPHSPAASVRVRRQSQKPAGCTTSSSSAAATAAAVHFRKRTKCPGVRVVGSRIYDSERGKTCHQCRQKTMDFSASCKHVRGDKLCPINFCHKCLLNRYGENAEEVALLENWICPKCRGVCNCSFCMKKKGQQPTGILIHTAKATGFSSVHDLLGDTKSEVLIAADGLRNLSSANSFPSKKGSMVVRSRGKENFNSAQKAAERSFCGDDSKVESRVMKEKSKTSAKRKSLSDSVNLAQVSSDHIETRKFSTLAKDAKKASVELRKSLVQPKTNHSNHQPKDSRHVPKPPKDSINDVNIEIDTKGDNVSNKSKGGALQNRSFKRKNNTENTGSDQGKELEDSQKVTNEAKSLLEQQEPRKCNSSPFDTRSEAPVIPQGKLLTELVGSEWAAEDIGAALQFLEFCNAFSEILDLKKGEPQSILRELARGRTGRRGMSSLIVKFHIKLSSLIQKDIADESVSYSANCGDKWWQSLVKCIMEYDRDLQPPLDFLKDTHLVYDSFDRSNKLRLLNLVCDMALGTEELRNWIDEENNKYAERNRETKKTIIDIKKKNKELKKKLRDNVARAMISLRGQLLSVAEHDKLMSQIRADTEKAEAELLELNGMMPKESDNLRRDAVRTEPLRLEGDGRIYWKLASRDSNWNLMLQDVGRWDSPMLTDKWFAYDEDEEKQLTRMFSFQNSLLN